MPERGPPITRIALGGWWGGRRAASVILHGAILSAVLALLLISSPQAQAITIGQKLDALSIVQPFTGDAESIELFEYSWWEFYWASGKGSDTPAGWTANSTYPATDGALSETWVSDSEGSGGAAAVTMAESPSTNGHHFSLWLNTWETYSEYRFGYELRFTRTATDTYSVSLRRWYGFTPITLRSQSGVMLSAGDSVAIVDQGLMLSVWTDTGAGFTQLLSASDSLFAEGQVGLSGAGTATTLTAFKAGQLTVPAPTLRLSDPASPADENAPRIIGSAIEGATVNVFKDSGCEGEPVASGTAEELESPGIEVTVADNTTTDFYADATDELGRRSECSSPISYTERSTTSGADALEYLAVIDALDTPENPFSKGGEWAKLATASHAGQIEGSGQTGGWGPYNAYPAIDGGFWKQKSFGDSGAGAAVAATLAVSPSSVERHFSLWLDMPSPGSAQSGYEVRFTQTATAHSYKVTLSRWQTGARTVLASLGHFAFAPQSSFALVDKGNVVSVWTDTGSGYGQLLSASDTTFHRGYVGIEGSGSVARLQELRAGASTIYIGEAEFQHNLDTHAATYIPEQGAQPRTVHMDTFAAVDGAEQPLPDTEDYVTCATSGHRIKIAYSSPARPAVPSVETRNQILSIVRRTNSKIVRESQRASGHTRALTMRVDCDANGVIRIHEVTSQSNEYESIMEAAKALDNPVGPEAVKYLVFRDALRYNNLDGIAESSDDASKTSSDAVDGSGTENRIFTGVAVVYKGPPGEHIWESHTPLHEITHAMGAVVDSAPLSSIEGHCYDGLDIMCYDEGRLAEPYSEGYCPVGTDRGYNTPLGVPLDCNYDSYFDTATEPGEWLETHWNIGGIENPYLVERPADIPPGGYQTETFVTPREIRDGPPGSVSVYGHVNTVNAGGHVVDGEFLNVNFQKWENDDWVTKEEHTVHPTVTSGYYEANDVGTLGVGRWRLRTVLPKQGWYASSESGYHEFEIDAIPTTAFITLDRWQNGAPGTASLHGHVKRTGNEAPVPGRVNVNFQKLVSGRWETMSTADRTLDGNGYWEVVDWGVGVGSWRVRAVFDQQDGYAYAESEYRTFDIQPVPTEAPITLVGFQNGTPGTASLQGHVRRTSNRAPASGRVKVNFQKLEGGVWTTKSTADRTLDGNGFWEVVNWGVGVGSWRVRAVYDQQGDYAAVESEYRTFDIQPVPTYAPITLDGWQNGAPGTATLHGHVLRVGNNAPARGTVKVNFQRWNGSSWQTMSTADRTLDGNGYWGVSNWGVGLGSWRARAVYDQQGDYGYAESEYRSFDIQPVATQAYLTINQVVNGSPGRVSVSGNVLWWGGGACCGVNVNFQKWNGSSWQTMSTATPGLSNGFYAVNNWGVGVGSWRVRTVFNPQGDFAYSESPYHSFNISR